MWAWGTFRDSSGPIGLVEAGKLQTVPVAVLPGVQVTKVASGSDHLVMLTKEGELYTMGNAEQGQLGRWGHLTPYSLHPAPGPWPLAPGPDTCAGSWRSSATAGGAAGWRPSSGPSAST